MTELEYIKKELVENQDLASFCVIYDRKNKKLLATVNGEDHLIDQMMSRAVTTNDRIKGIIRRVSVLTNESRTPPSDFFDIFNKFRK